MRTNEFTRQWEICFIPLPEIYKLKLKSQYFFVENEGTIRIIATLN